MSKKQGRFKYLCNFLVQGLNRGGWIVVLLGLLTAGLSVYYTARYLAFRTDRSDLISSNLRLTQLNEKMNQAFGAHLDSLVVVVHNGSKQRSIAFAEALAAELRPETTFFSDLFYRVNPERFKHWALLYLEPDQLRDLKVNLLAHRQEMTALAGDPRLTEFFRAVNSNLTRTMIGELFTSFLEEDKGKEPIPDLSLLNATLRQLHLQLEGAPAYQSPFRSLFPGDLGDFSQEGYFFTENDKYLLFLVTPKSDGYADSAQILKRLREVVARVKAGFPGLEAGVTGTEALEDDEMSSAMGDITFATWLSLLSQMVLLIIFLRSFRRTLMEGVVLVIGLCWTFGMVTLVVGHLNLLSIIFAPLMLGLTIDFGIHWCCRLEEEQEGGSRCSPANLSCTMRRATPAIIYASLAAMGSFFPLVFTGFKGLAELGLILAMGVALMTLATLILLPSLVMVSEKCKIGALDVECKGHPRPFLSLHWRHPIPLVAVGGLVTLLGMVILPQVPFDLNPLHLQNPNTESVAWEMRLLQDSRYSTTYGAMLSSNLSDLQEKSAALKQMSTVSHVESILSFLPTDLPAKRRSLQELASIVEGVSFPPVLTQFSTPQELKGILGRIHFKLAQAAESAWDPQDKATQEQVREASRLLSLIIPLLDPARNPQAVARLLVFEKDFFADLKDKWDLIQANLSAEPPQIKDMPQEVARRFIGPEGNYLLRVFPAQDIWELEPLSRFVKDLQTVDPDAVGDPVLLYVFTLAFRNACLWAAGLALLAISLLLLAVFRSVKMVLLALVPLVMGTGLTVCTMWLLKIPFNQANVLFLPLILGEGVEFGIIILTRWKREKSARAMTLPASTAKGVLLAALTTTAGFGSLMISGHRGVFSLGLLATVGSLSVLLASLSILPAFLRLLEKGPVRARPILSMGLRQWILSVVKRETP